MGTISPDEAMKQADDERFARFCRWLAKRPDLPTVARDLRTLREMSLREAAFHAQRSASYLDRVEHGLRRPERDTLIALCLRAYDLTVRETGRILLLAGFAPMRHEKLAFMLQVWGAEQAEAVAKAIELPNGTLRLSEP